MKMHFRLLLAAATLSLAIAGVAMKLQNDSLEQTASAHGGAP